MSTSYHRSSRVSLERSPPLSYSLPSSSSSSMALTYPRPNRIRSRLPLVETEAELSAVKEEDDDDDDGLAAFDKRSTELLRARKKPVGDCATCKRFLDFATKVQAENKEMKSNMESLKDEFEAERLRWKGEKHQMEKKREVSQRALREELDRATQLLKEEAEVCGRRVRDFRAIFERETLAEANRSEEMRRNFDRQLSEMRARAEEADSQALHELKRVRMELEVAQEKYNNLELISREARAERDHLKQELGVAKKEKDLVMDSARMERESHASAIETLKRDHDAVIRILETEKEAMEINFRSDFSERLKIERVRLQETFEHDLDHEKQSQKTRMERIQADHESALTELRNSIQTLKADHQLTMDRLVSNHQDSIDASRKELDQARVMLKGIQETSASELARIKREFEVLTSSHAEESQRQEEKIRTLTDALKNAEELHKSKYAAEVASLKESAESSQAEMMRLKETTESSKAEMKKKCESLLANMQMEVNKMEHELHELKSSRKHSPSSSSCSLVVGLLLFATTLISVTSLAFVFLKPKLHYSLTQEILAISREMIMSMFGIASLVAPPM